MALPVTEQCSGNDALILAWSLSGVVPTRVLIVIARSGVVPFGWLVSKHAKTTSLTTPSATVGITTIAATAVVIEASGSTTC